MANEYKIRITIDDTVYEVKELRCKNDNCRKLIGYDNMRLGVFIHNCDCGTISLFHMNYPKAKKHFMDTLKQKFESKEGGEKING